MARLILASALDDAAQRFRWLRTLLFAFEAAFVYLCWYAFKALSPERASRLGRRIVSVLGRRSPKAAILKTNLAIALPQRPVDEIERVADAVWGNVGAVFGEYPHLAVIGSRSSGRVEITDQCGLDTYRRRERRAIFFGAHVSNWEIMGIALAREGVPVMALYAPLQNGHLDRLMNRARLQLGCEMLPRDGSMRRLFKHLQDNGSMGLLVDLKVDDGIEVPFFGVPMLASPTPARLAARYQCDLVPIVTTRTGDARYHFTVLPPLPSPPGELDEEASIFWRTRAMMGAIESFITAHPEEWLATNKRWSKTHYVST